jgi:prohibitin 1
MTWFIFEWQETLPQPHDDAHHHLDAKYKHIAMAAVPSSLFRWLVPAAIGASVVQSSIYDVKGGTRAVIFDRVSGVKEQVVNEGTHFLIPWLQRAIVYDVRTRPRNISTTTGSKDLQMVTLTLRVLHRPEVKQLPKIYQVRLLGHTKCSYRDSLYA